MFFRKTSQKVTMKVEIIIQFLASVFLIEVIKFTLADVKSVFEEFKIVPDIVDNAPLKEIEVKYGDQKVTLGKEFTPTFTKDPPEVCYEYESGVFYTLVFIDPDTPTKESVAEVRHWLIGNIFEDKISEGEVLTDYLSPAPPPDTGKHRYTFLLYKQNQKIMFDEPYVGRRSVNRFNFFVRKLAEKYNLEGPIAGNFLLVEYDDYVPIVYKELGFDYPY